MRTTAGVSGTVADARDAVARGDWDVALDLLRSVAEEVAGSPEGLELLATAAYGAGDFEGAVTAWEDLHALSRLRGEPIAAARAAAMVAMYLMMDTGLMAPVRGWLARAERLLDGEGETGVHAHLAMVRTYERLMCGDFPGAGRCAQEAVDIGARHGVLAAVAIGGIARGRVRIFDGHVEEGLRLLDEVAVMVVSGELDALTTGMAYCELICAMQGLAMYDRAEQWTEAMERWRHGAAVGGIDGRCRVHRAEILRLRGSCEEAEQEALRACEALRPWMRREFGWPLTELGTIRLRKGDLAGAEEAFLAAHENAWEPQPGLALLRLAQGDAESAAELIRHALEQPFDIPSKERPPSGSLRRAPLLDAQVEIAAAAGDVATARTAADELTAIATRFPSKALVASAALARCRASLAAGDVAAAVADGDTAVTAWIEVGAPYEAAVARTVLVQAYRAAGNETRARLEHGSATAAFARLGARHWSAGDHDRGRRLNPAAQTSPASSASAANVFRCDGDTRTVSFAGTQVLLRDLKGLRYLERLLAEPGREFHVLDLVAGERGAVRVGHGAAAGDDLTTSDGGHAGVLIDDRAREAYRRRLAEVDQDIEEAHRMHDPERAALAAADREYLVQELARAVGLGGRSRRAGDTAERARTSVTRAVRYAMARIREHHPALAEHLELTVQTGLYCRYAPDPRVPVAWVTDERPRTSRRAPARG